MVISYHNVTGRVLEGRLGRLAAPIRALMLLLERRVAVLADAIVCVSGRDRRTLAQLVLPEPFARAVVIPAAFDGRLFAETAGPPEPHLARLLLLVGRISHQKNVPLAIAVLERLVAEGESYELTIAGEGEDSRQLAPPHRDQPGRGPHPLDRPGAARPDAGSPGSPRHPAPDQPLRGLADRGQGGA